MGLQAQHNTLIASVSAKHDIKACVKRDLEWLFNAIQYVPNEGLDELPESARSVINFGIPDFFQEKQFLDWIWCKLSVCYYRP